MITKSKEIKTEEALYCIECGDDLIDEFDICDNMFCDIGIDNWNG